MKTKIEQFLLTLTRVFRQYSSSKMIEALWITLLYRENQRNYPKTLLLWNEVKAQAEIDNNRPLWTAPELDEVSKIRARKMIDTLIAELIQERELLALKQKSLENGTHLEKTLLIA